MNVPAKRTLFAAIIGVHVLLLLKIWYDWRFSYFSLDDFNNLYWFMRVDGPGMLWHVVNPMSDFFRPVGMSVYWLMWHAFGLNAVPFHALTWTLHVSNVIL